MSRVSKCDFCGTIYDSTKADVSCRETVLRDAYICIYADRDGEASAYDVCPHCTDKIRSVIEVMKNGDNFVIEFTSKEE